MIELGLGWGWVVRIFEVWGKLMGVWGWLIMIDSEFWVLEGKINEGFIFSGFGLWGIVVRGVKREKE